MIRLDKLCNWLIIICLAGLLPSIVFIKYLDELGSFAFLTIALADCLFNRNYKRYVPLFVMVGVMFFYLVYTLMFKSYNTTPYVLMDFVLEIKPFLPLLVIMAIRPVLSATEKSTIKTICVVNAILVVPIYFLNSYMVEQTVGHLAYCGAAAFISSLLYLFCSMKPDGSIDKQDKLIAMALLACGLPCMKAKFLAEAVLTLFALWIYKPMMFHGFKFQHMLVGLLLIGVLLAVTWNKISYYFITGNSGTFNPSEIQTYARPVLYATAGLIIADYTLLGSGLASFASYASAANYSGLYYEYGIDKVYGLSEVMPDFICDAYYPSLTQFGLIGIILFIVFWRIIYKKLFILYEQDITKLRYSFIIGTLALFGILIENTTGTIFSQSHGMVMASIIGYAYAHECIFIAKTNIDKQEHITKYNYGK